MKKSLTLAFVALSCAALAEPPQKIDVSLLAAQTQMIDQGVVAVPSEFLVIFVMQAKQVENAKEVKNIGDSVLTLGEAIELRRAMLKRSK